MIRAFFAFNGLCWLLQKQYHRPGIKISKVELLSTLKGKRMCTCQSLVNLPINDYYS